MGKPESQINALAIRQPKSAGLKVTEGKLTIESLTSQVLKALTSNYSQTADFLPYDQLEAFVRPEIVTELVNEANIASPESLATFVLKNGKRLFLILVLVAEDSQQLHDLLRSLQSHCITDTSLPIEFRRNEAEEDFYYGATIGAHKEEIRHDFFNGWKRRERDLLWTYQWKFLAPVFGNGTFRFDFHERIILPYLAHESKPSSSGFFGEVSRVEIHKAHVPELRAVSELDCNLTDNLLIPSGLINRQSCYRDQKGQTQRRTCRILR